MAGLGYLIAAYAAVGLGLLGYAVWLWLRSRRVAGEIALLPPGRPGGEAG